MRLANGLVLMERLQGLTATDVSIAVIKGDYPYIPFMTSKIL